MREPSPMSLEENSVRRMSETVTPPMNPSQSAAHQLADHLFRHESGKMVSILPGIYGARNLQLAEDAILFKIPSAEELPALIAQRLKECASHETA